MPAPMIADHTDVPSTGGRLVAPDGRTLPLRGAWLEAEAGGGIARVIVRQSFVNPFPDPLRVTYLLPLPSDGAVSGFSFRVAGRRVAGEIERRRVARERFEQALVEGRTAAILEEDRSSLFTQEVGNIPPRAEVEVEIEIDQRLRWLAEGAWEWRFPTVVGARYLGAQGRVPDAERVVVDVSEHGLPAKVALSLAIDDRIHGRVESPSHALSVETKNANAQVELQKDAALDRDVVVRWPVAALEPSASLQVARSPRQDDAHGLLTIVPPLGKVASVARDLIFLIDTSGSMHGAPLDQAKRIGAAMIDTLGPEDRIELISFGNAPERFRKEPLAATREGRRAAIEWLKKLRSSGGTEMVRAVIEALAPLRPDSQRQVVLITDGYIGFERELVRELRERLPAGARLHTVGVGSAINRTLTQWAARAGGGVEVIVGLGEDPERAAARLLARTTAPIVTELTIEGARATAPACLPDLYAGAPAMISLALDPRGGPIVVRGKTARGAFEQRVEAGALALGEGSPAITTLYGRERVEDLETELAARGTSAELDSAIESTGLAFRISTRLTSWVAISEAAMIDPDAEKRRVTQPHEAPHGVSIEGLGLRGASAEEDADLYGFADAGAAPARGRLAAPAPYPVQALGGSPMLGAPASMPGAPPAPMATPASATGAWRMPEQAPLARKRVSRSWLWVVLVLVVIATAIGAWLALFRPRPAAEPRTPQTQEVPARE